MRRKLGADGKIKAENGRRLLIDSVSWWLVFVRGLQSSLIENSLSGGLPALPSAKQNWVRHGSLSERLLIEAHPNLGLAFLPKSCQYDGISAAVKTTITAAGPKKGRS